MIPRLWGLVGMAVLGLIASHRADAAELKITVTGVLPAEKSTVRVVVITDPDGNARQDISRNVDGTLAKDGALSTQFYGLAPGYYGIVVIEESGANHALEKAVTGSVSKPMATSTEVKVTLTEPSTLVSIPLMAAR